MCDDKDGLIRDRPFDLVEEVTDATLHIEIALAVRKLRIVVTQMLIAVGHEIIKGLFVKVSEVEFNESRVSDHCFCRKPESFPHDFCSLARAYAGRGVDARDASWQEVRCCSFNLLPTLLRKWVRCLACTNDHALHVTLRFAVPHRVVAITALLYTLLKFIDGSNNDTLGTVLVFPYRQWRAPVPLARDCPVLRITKPLTHTSIAYMIRLPVHCFIFLKQRLTQIVHADKPRIARVIDKTILTTPAMWVGVRIVFL